MSDQTLTQPEPRPIIWRGGETHMHVIAVEVGNVTADVNGRTGGWIVFQKITIRYVDGSHAETSIHYTLDSAVGLAAIARERVYRDRAGLHSPDVNYIPVPADAER